MNTLQFKERRCFYSTRIEEYGKEQTELFKLTKNLMGSTPSANLAHFTSAELLTDEFSNLSMRKTTIINNKIVSDSPTNT